jgi:hypothetical protein
MVRGTSANAEWRRDQEKRGTRVKKAEKEEDKNGSKSSIKKAVENEDLLKCAGTLRVLFLERQATHVLNHEWAHVHDGWRVV